jgi:erythromycin esterase
MIGDATVVALGEGDHLVSEPLLFRNRLLQYLVEKKGFTAIALESGIIEGRLVHDYVRGGDGDFRAVLSRGLSWTFDQLPQNVALIRWLRDYNANPRHPRKVNFYGFDVPGSPGNPDAKRGMDTALLEVLKYLERIDPSAASVFHARIDSFLPRLRFDRCRPESPGYHQFSRVERDSLTAAIADLRALMQAREARYTAAGIDEDYQWAVRASIGAQQVDSWLRQIPHDWQASGEQFRFLDSAGDLRDKAQADNLDWIVAQEGLDGKVLVFAHNGHLSAAPIKWTWQLLDRTAQRRQGNSEPYFHEIAGTYLRRRLGHRLCIIGNLMGRGELGYAGFRKALESAPLDSLDGLAQEVGMRCWVADLRSAPADVRHWLNQERTLGRGIELTGKYRISFGVPALEAFDILFYLDTVTPAVSPYPLESQ